MKIKRWWTPLCVLALSGALSGCGQDVFAGGQRARVEGEVTDAPDDAASGARFSRASSGESAAASEGALEGTIELTARLELVREGGEVVPVTEGTTTGTLRIATRDVVPLGAEVVAAGSYPLARVTFTRLQARVTSGLLGVPGAVVVELAEPVTIEDRIDLRLREDDERTVVVDLNASVWLAAAVGGVIPAAVFRQAVEVRVR